MDEPKPERNGSREDEPDGPIAMLQGRVDRLESTVAALGGELSSVLEQLTALSRTRETFPPALPVRANVEPPTSSAVRAHPSPLPVSDAVAAPPAAALPTFSYGKDANAGKRAESLESQLGSRVLSKVAVVLLLAGTAWFLKWAFDNRWVGPAGRVLIGLLAGAGVVVWSERFRRQSLAAFSYALKAVGSGVLYLSLWAGFHLYHLMPGPVALLAMIAVTAANAVLALTQASPLLAGYALLGAYLTPALLSTGGNHEVFLFTYLFMVALSVAMLVRLRPWHLLLCGAFCATVGYYIGWYSEHYAINAFGVTLVFALLLWAVFAVVPILAKESDGVIVGVLTPVGGAAFGALAVYSVLVDSGQAVWKPWAALVFAAAYLLLMRARRGGLVAAMHLSLAIVFLTITIPLKATGRGITAGWLVEGVVLLWVATLPQVDTRARRALRWLGCASLLLGVLGALLGPILPFEHTGPAFLNRDFVTSLGALAALAAAAVVSRRDPGDFGHMVATSAFVLGNIVLLAAMGREIHNLDLYAPAASWRSASEHADFTFSAWLMLQGVANLIAGFLRRVALARWAGLLLLGVTLIKVFAYDMRSLGTGYHVLSYLGLGVVLLAVSFAYQKDWLGLREAVANEEPAAMHEAQP